MIKTKDLVVSMDWRDRNAQSTPAMPYQLLGNAIVEQAVRDYRQALAVVNQYGSLVDKYKEMVEALELHLFINRTELDDDIRGKIKRRISWLKSVTTNVYQHQKILIECEEFFLSDWFATLTKIDGSRLLERLRKDKPAQQEPVA